MHVAITGIAGFIGSHLAQRLAGHEVRGFDNGRSGDFSRVPSWVDCQQVDIVSPDAHQWAQHLEGVEVLFHLAAEKYNSSRTTPQRVIDTNVSATARLLQGAAEAGVRQVVFTSSLYAYGSRGPQPMHEGQPLTPDTYYGMSKVAGENLLRVAARDHGLAWACARLFFIYGPRQYAEGGYKSVIMSNFERMAAGQPPRVNGDGEQRLDYVYIDDATDALVRLADPANADRTVNIGSGFAPSINELTTAMSRVAGYEGPWETGPADWTAGSVRCADPERAATTVPWRATTDLQTGLTAVWTWLSQAQK